MEPDERMITCAPPPVSTEDTNQVGGIQQPRAPEVILRPLALEEPAVPGHGSDTMERWNMDPAGSVLACAGPPASSDTTGVDMNGPY
jgi:hypothetical protein